MSESCPVCGGEALKLKYKDSLEAVSYSPVAGFVVTSKGKLAVCVTKCSGLNGCGARVSWYPDGGIVIWKTGGAILNVPVGTLMVSPGEEV